MLNFFFNLINFNFLLVLFVCSFIILDFFCLGLSSLFLNYSISISDFYLNLVLSLDSSLSPIQFVYFLPEIFFFILVFFFIFYSLFTSQNPINFWNLWQVWTLVFFLFFLFWNFVILDSNTSIFLFNNMLIIDFYSVVIKGFILGLFFILFYFFNVYTNVYSDYSNSAIQIILLSFICVLFLILSSVFHFFILYVILEALTFSLVTLYVVSANLSFSIESALKYYYLNVIASAFILFSLLILHFGTYSFDFLILKTQLLFFSGAYNQFFFNYFFIFFFFGFLFKLSAFPCSLWAPDVYEGLNFPLLFLFAVVLKVAYLSIFLRICVYLVLPVVSVWYECFLFAAFGSIIWGAFGAIFQTRLKRFFAYTSINQIGFLLLAFTAFSSVDGLVSYFFYLFVYVLSGCLFFLSLITNTSVLDFNKLGSVNFLSDLIRAFQLPYENFTFEENEKALFFRSAYVQPSVLLFSLAILIFSGLPPFIGFFSKFFLFLITFQNLPFVVIFLILLSTVVSIFYYLRLLKLVWFDSRPNLFSAIQISGSTEASKTVNFLSTQLDSKISMPMLLNYIGTKILNRNFFFKRIEFLFFNYQLFLVIILVLILPFFMDFLFSGFYLLAECVISPFSFFR